MKRNSVELANKTKLSTLGSNIFLSRTNVLSLSFFLSFLTVSLAPLQPLFVFFLSLARLINGYFYLLYPNANCPSAVAWLWSNFNGKSVKQVKKNSAKVAMKTLVSTFSSFSSFSFYIGYFYLSRPNCPNDVAGVFNFFFNI